MAFDGIVTYAVVRELQDKLILGKIEKVYQPENDELVFMIHTKSGNLKLLASCGSQHARIHFVEEMPVNPPEPTSFCMLLRKHLQGGRITDVQQYKSERIVEISLETLNELGFTVSKKLIFEIMGKHSNVVLVDIESGKIIDSIKRISFDSSRVRQVLPGMIYVYPPEQDKIPFKEVTDNDVEWMKNGNLLKKIGGISPAFAGEIEAKENPYEFLKEVTVSIESGNVSPRIYYDDKDNPVEFHTVPLAEYESVCETETFASISDCLEKFFKNRVSSNQASQKSRDLIKSVASTLDKMYLKKKRLSEDLLKAENSDDLRLYGELLTANLHLVQPGMKSVKVINYYDGSQIEIPLDVKASPQKNAQHYFKKYGKAKTAVKEKAQQLEENQTEINYLESVLSFLENTDSVEEVEALRQELVETGYIRRRKQGGFKDKKVKISPVRYKLKNGMDCLVGRNNRENDELTLRMAGKGDLWLHTKDIPGSHVIVSSRGAELDEETIFEAAAIAAYHSKARQSENVPVDYVPIKYVKKPAGAKPGMVIFTNNRTVWVNPQIPEKQKV